MSSRQSAVGLHILYVKMAKLQLHDEAVLQHLLIVVNAAGVFGPQGDIRTSTSSLRIYSPPFSA
jgi:hypothetical protein